MDAFARAILIAESILKNSDYRTLRKKRYRTFDSGAGKKFESGKLKLTDLAKYALEHGEPKMISGKQELLENIIIQHI